MSDNASKSEQRLKELKAELKADYYWQIEEVYEDNKKAIKLFSALVDRVVERSFNSGYRAANDQEKAGREKSDLMRLVSRNTDIMERLGLVEGCLKDSEEYQRLHVDTIKQLIETCRDLYADYKMHHDPRIRKVLMKEGLMFPETEEELEIFEKHNPPEEGSCDISAEEMLKRIKEKET